MTTAGMDDMALLTKRQREILDFLHAFVKESGYAPSLSEIAWHFGLSSPATVHEHLKALEEKGFIERGWNKKRSVNLLTTTDRVEYVEIPLLGQIAAGQPIEAILDDQTVSVPRDMVGGAKRYYALRVRGESMIDEHILDGDLVVVQSVADAANGDTVVALVLSNTATLKKFYREGRQVRLQPANPTMNPIVLNEEDVKIQGIVVGLIRRYS
ncbi:MAG: transcriptional repressor LexA [FCB group bacterium]|jgi:repressor LexA|nr:transcriptional repressor LexA [FCB group bacterium]